MSAALFIDFGSTYTKLRAVDLETAEIIGRGQGPSTVTDDVTIGLEAAFDDLRARSGALPAFAHRLASSSAAGGLAMVTVGLVRELTAEAARQAALGAGAKLIGTFAYTLTAADCDAIAALAPDVLLLAGGTDGGNDEVIVHNAEVLAACPLSCPVVVAGNRQAADRVRRHTQGLGQSGDGDRERHARIRRPQHRTGRVPPSARSSSTASSTPRASTAPPRCSTRCSCRPRRRCWKGPGFSPTAVRDGPAWGR